VVSNDWVIRYDTRVFQIARQSGHAPARSTVLVRENAAGAIEMRYRGRVMHWSEMPARRRSRRHAGNAPGHPGAGACTHATERPVGRSSVAPQCRRLQDQAAARGGQTGMAGRAAVTQPPVDAAGAVDREEHAPTAPWKTTERFSTTTTRHHTGDISISLEWDISISL
jgi:hypothetical protein